MDDSMKGPVRIVVFAAVALALVIGCLPVCYAVGFLGLSLANRATRPKMSEVTTPLEPAVVQDLCEKLSVPENSNLCKPGAVVYAPEFFPAVYRSFTIGVTTYGEVQARIGAYQYEREPSVAVPSLGGTFFRCLYDFRGDRVFPFGLTFTEEGTLYDIDATAWDD